MRPSKLFTNGILLLLSLMVIGLSGCGGGDSGGTNTTQPQKPEPTGSSNIAKLSISKFEIEPTEININDSFNINWDMEFDSSEYSNEYFFELHLGSTSDVQVNPIFSRQLNIRFTPGSNKDSNSLSCVYEKSLGLNYFMCSSLNSKNGSKFVSKTLNQIFDLNKPLYAMGRVCVNTYSSAGIPKCAAYGNTIMLKFAP